MLARPSGVLMEGHRHHEDHAHVQAGSTTLRPPLIQERSRDSFGRTSSANSHASTAASMARAFRSIENRLLGSARRICVPGSAVANSYRRSASDHSRRVLCALAAVRDALNEAIRLDFGKRFALELRVTDREGWPMLELHLMDRHQEFLPGLTGTVSDSMTTGALEYAELPILFTTLNHSQSLGHVSIDPSGDFEEVIELFLESLGVFLERIGNRLHEAQRQDRVMDDTLVMRVGAPGAAKTPTAHAPSGHAHIADEELESELKNLDFLS